MTRVILLYWWARYRTVWTKHTTVTDFRLQYLARGFALVQPQAKICWHLPHRPLTHRGWAITESITTSETILGCHPTPHYDRNSTYFTCVEHFSLYFEEFPSKRNSLLGYPEHLLIHRCAADTQPRHVKNNCYDCGRVANGIIWCFRKLNIS